MHINMYHLLSIFPHISLYCSHIPESHRSSPKSRPFAGHRGMFDGKIVRRSKRGMSAVGHLLDTEVLSLR